MGMKAGDRIIVALDDMNEKQALTLAKKLEGTVWGFKVNSLYSRNPKIVEMLKPYGKVFVDMKIHDIPRTAANHATEQLQHEADIINVHSSGGFEMMDAVRKVIDNYNETNKKECLLIAVTVLTSLSKNDCKEIYGKIPKTQVMLLSDMAIDAEMDGTVCSPQEVYSVKEKFPSFVAVTPGIRLAGDDVQDQKRLDTPYNAILNGADFLVIGSSITKAKNSAEAVVRITQEIKAGRRDRSKKLAKTRASLPTW